MISKAAQTIRDTLVRDTLDGGSIAEKRKAWEEACLAIELPAGVDVSRVEIEDVACLQCLPASGEFSRTILYCHGGGLVEGSANVFTEWSARLALQCNCRVLTVDYRLAPENPYPAAVNDVVAVYHALLDTHSSNSIAIGADSSGCILALALLATLDQTASHHPEKLFLLSPSVDLAFTGASIETNRQSDPVVSIEVLKHYATLYAGNEALDNSLVSPLYADIPIFPPTLIFIDEDEILYSDASRLADRIRAVGGAVKMYCSRGLWHVWPLWSDFPESREAIGMIQEHLNAGRTNLAPEELRGKAPTQ